MIFNHLRSKLFRNTQPVDTMRLFYLTALLVILATTIYTPLCRSESTFESYLGKEVLETLRNPDIVLYCSVENEEGVQGHEKLVECGALTAEQLKRVSEIFMSEENFDFEKSKTNVFIPELAIIFKKEIQVTVYVGLASNQMKLISHYGEKKLDYSPHSPLVNGTLLAIQPEVFE